MEIKAKKTKYRIEKEARDLKIYQDWRDEMEKPGAMVTAVNQYVMQKYGIHSTSNVWAIRKRVEARLAGTTNNTEQP